MAPVESLHPTGEAEPVFNLPIGASKGCDRAVAQSKDLQEKRSLQCKLPVSILVMNRPL